MQDWPDRSGQVQQVGLRGFFFLQNQDKSHILSYTAGLGVFTTRRETLSGEGRVNFIFVVKSKSFMAV